MSGSARNEARAADEAVYVIEGMDEDRGFTVGWAIRDSRDGSFAKIVDMESRCYDDASIVLKDREHASDFAAAMNLGAKAREEAGR